MVRAARLPVSLLIARRLGSWTAAALALGLVRAPAARGQAHNEGKPAQAAPRAAQPGAPPTPVTPAVAPGTYRLEDTAALGDFIDGVMRAHIEELHIPAAVAVVIENGRVLYARGYGHANIAHGTPVDPATSLFRIGSTSKLFTWTAVMQLVEQGTLDLDTDVNHYLKGLQIPATFPQPVTLRSLMTHSPGFEDGALGYLIIEDSSRVLPIDETLRRHMPARVRPPLTLSSYSNYGAALAGLIVQQASGEPFNEYIQHHILDPLDMHHATFQEPLPPALRGDAVTGYARENGDYVAKPFEFVGGFRPAGSMSASALDMTHFMIAHLQDGRYGSAQILKPATAELMHRPAFANDPRLPPMDLGFYEQRMNGVRFIGHEGDTEHFHTAMFIIPDRQVGIFLSYVGDGGDPARSGMLRAFFDRYFPETALDPPPPAPAADFATTAAKYTGAYRFARHSSTEIEKALLLAEPPIRVSLLPKEGRLLVTGLGTSAEQYVPIATGLFQRTDGHQQIAFHEDSASGQVTRLSVSELPFMGTERVPWAELPSRWYTLLGISTLLFLSVLTGLYYRRQEFRAMTRAPKRASWLAAVTAGWYFLTWIVLGAVIAVNASTLFSRVPGSLEAALVLPVIFVVLTVLLVIAAVQVWRHRYWTVGRRVHFSLVAAAAVIVCLFFNQWNILGWHFG